MEQTNTHKGRTIRQEIFSSRDDALATLAAAFPEAVKDGEVDWEALQDVIGYFPATGSEKYELTWAGKAEAKRDAARDALGRTLRYCPAESKNSETTRNLYIEGDNLEALKLLRENYYGAVKMIYIDPPYNTGNDFVYRDNFTQAQAESELAEGNINELGERLVRNTKSSNRYHAHWLSMMYPRLKLARTLLRDDGVMFISIDDNEAHNLRKLCDEVFGEENFLAHILWQKKYAVSNDDPGIAPMHDHILVYQRSDRFERRLLPRTEKQLVRYKNLDNDPRGDWSSDNYISSKSRWERPTLWYPIKHPKTGAEVWPDENAVWRYSLDKHEQMVAENRLYWGPDQNYERPRLKRFLNEVQDGVVPSTWWTFEEVGHNDEAVKETGELIGKKIFSTPKPIRLLKRILEISTRDGDLILDFFSGSGATAHAVMQMNAEDGGNRKFICVQIPEPTDDNSDAYKAGYTNIADIGKERIRRAGEKIKAELIERRKKETGDLFDKSGTPGPDTFDIGFKVFKVADTVIRWTHDALKNDGKLAYDEEALSDKDRLDFMPGFNDLDVVYEIALRQNDIPLSAAVRAASTVGPRTYLYADTVAVCLEETVTKATVEALAAIEPTPAKYVFRDSAFGDDIALKDETLRRLDALIARNTGGIKKTHTVDFL